MKLSKTQIKVIKKMADGEWKNAFVLQCSIATLNSLVSKDILIIYSKFGQVCEPHINQFYRLKEPFDGINALLEE